MTFMTTSASSEKQEPPHALWRFGAYVGNDIRIIVQLDSPGCLDVKHLCEQAVDADGNADLSALFGSPVSETTHDQ